MSKAETTASTCVPPQGRKSHCTQQSARFANNELLSLSAWTTSTLSLHRTVIAHTCCWTYWFDRGVGMFADFWLARRVSLARVSYIFFGYFIFSMKRGNFQFAWLSHAGSTLNGYLISSDRSHWWSHWARMTNGGKSKTLIEFNQCFSSSGGKHFKHLLFDFPYIFQLFCN